VTITGYTSTLSVSLRWSQSEIGDLSTTTDAQQLTHSASKTLGTASGNANLVWHDTLSAGATLDPASLPRSVFGVGGEFNFSSLKTVRIKNAAASGAATITIPPCGIADPVTLTPGAILVLDSPDGWAVSDPIVVTGATNLEVVLVGVGTVTP
jgi:hypothetical protein